VGRGWSKKGGNLGLDRELGLGGFWERASECVDVVLGLGNRGDLGRRVSVANLGRVCCTARFAFWV